MTIDSARIEAAVVQLLEAIGDDPARDGLRETPRRVAEAAAELFAGVGRDAVEPLIAPSGFDGSSEPVGEFVALRGIAFRSMCEHHLLPFVGTAAIVYAPRDRIVGLGALTAVVELAAARPQLQERLTDQIAEAIERGLDARGVLVVLEASHGCVSARGPRQTGVVTATVAARGALAEPAGRAEAMALVAGSAA
jgi:GTP cyclohydrolase I